ncbi:MAG: hypothetical protein ACPGU1_18325 [Myxococcota bacterium]
MTDHAGAGLTRTELVSVALMAAIMGTFAQGYHPTNPPGTLFLRGFFAAVGLWAVVRLIRPGPASSWWRRLLMGAALLGGLPVAGMTVGTSWLVLQMRLPDLAIPLILAQIVLVLTLCAWAWRAPAVRRHVARMVALALFLNAFAYIPLAIWIWSPPAASECAAVARPGVTRLTPQTYPDALSIPYEVRYIPEEKKVLATFKMAGNTVLDFWDDPDANRLVVIDVADPESPVLADLPLPGDTLPEHTDYNPARREIVLNRVGYDVNSLDFIPLAAFPELSLRARRDLDYAPQGVVVFPDHETIGVFSVDLRFEAVDPVTGAPRDRQRIPYGGPTVMVTNLTRAPGSDLLYVSTFGQMVKELNLTTRELRQGKVPFGGGDIVHVPEMKRVYQANMVFRGLNVLDTRTMRLDRSLELSYQPRAVTADYGRDLLMVGAWFDGAVHLYRLSTLEALGPPVSVGTYLRKISYDAERGLLYAGSRCGVYQVDLDRVAEGASKGTP